MKLLVVDDSATMRRIVVNSLQRVGFTDVVEAGGGREALDRFDTSFGFVITAWNMPGLDGPALARELRARPDGRTVPILAVATGSARELVPAALEAGASDCIVKPFSPTVLRETIDRLLGADVVH